MSDVDRRAGPLGPFRRSVRWRGPVGTLAGCGALCGAADLPGHRRPPPPPTSRPPPRARPRRRPLLVSTPDGSCCTGGGTASRSAGAAPRPGRVVLGYRRGARRRTDPPGVRLLVRSAVARTDEQAGASVRAKAAIGVGPCRSPAISGALSARPADGVGQNSPLASRILVDVPAGDSRTGSTRPAVPRGTAAAGRRGRDVPLTSRVPRSARSPSCRRVRCGHCADPWFERCRSAFPPAAGAPSPGAGRACSSVLSGAATVPRPWPAGGRPPAPCLGVAVGSRATNGW